MANTWLNTEFVPVEPSIAGWTASNVSARRGITRATKWARGRGRVRLCEHYSGLTCAFLHLYLVDSTLLSFECIPVDCPVGQMGRNERFTAMKYIEGPWVDRARPPIGSTWPSSESDPVDRPVGQWTGTKVKARRGAVN